MEDDIFEIKMKGVKPLKKNKNLSRKKNNDTDIHSVKKIIKKNEQKENLTKKNDIKPKYNLIFNDINKDLKRGKIKIDRRVDLHGYSLLDAYDKFKKEVIKTYNRNQRCILIVTGKGLHLKKNDSSLTPKLFYGKIKNSIKNWITREDLQKYVLTYQDAGFEHGGDGAIFIYLRKKNN